MSEPVQPRRSCGWWSKKTAPAARAELADCAPTVSPARVLPLRELAFAASAS